MLRVLLVDDDPDIRKFVGASIRDQGHAVTEAVDGAEAFEHLGATRFDVVVSDIRLPRHDGIEVFRRARRESPTTDVILMTSFAAVPDAVAAMKEGAYDYLTKPFEAEELLARLDRIAAKRALERVLADARASLEGGDAAMTIVGESPPMARLRDRIVTVAASDAPVLVTGESGTGKELVARMLHTRSARRDGAFVAVNCAAFPETLLEAELFGHERGAFTGASKKRDGRFKAAHGGTLLLDEIAETPLAAQAKLLRVLQEGTIEPLGTNESVKVDVRVVSATNRDLKRRIAEGLFREDLYYRLNVVNLWNPPLRERGDDVLIIAKALLSKYADELKSAVQGFTPQALTAIKKHQWPGNIRQLENRLKKALVLCDKMLLGPEDLDLGANAENPILPLEKAKEEFQRKYVLEVLERNNGNRTQTARDLGRAVANNLVLDLLPPREAFLDEDAPAAGQCARREPLELLGRAGDGGALSAEREPGPQDHRKTYFEGRGEHLGRRMGVSAARHLHVDLGELRVEERAILRGADGVRRRAEHAHPRPREHARCVERETAVQRGLAAKREEDGIDLFALEDLLHELRLDGEKIDLVSELVRRLHGRDVRVQEDGAYALLAKRLQRLRSGVVELTGLANLERARPEHQDAARLLADRHDTVPTARRPCTSSAKRSKTCCVSCGPDAASG